MFMNKSSFTARIRWLAAAFAAVCAMLLSVDSLRAQNYSVTPARPATIESMRQVVEHKNSPSNPLGMIAGGLIGGGIGSLFGGGNGRTAATIVGALGGGYIGHNIADCVPAVPYRRSRPGDGSGTRVLALIFGREFIRTRW
jgi:outer membrane lipoprotein SlyB